MKKLIFLALAICMWVGNVQATDIPIFQYDPTTGQYYYEDDNGQPVYIPNEVEEDSSTSPYEPTEDEDSTPPPTDTETTGNTDTPTVTDGNASGNTTNGTEGENTTGSSTPTNSSTDLPSGNTETGATSDPVDPVVTAPDAGDQGATHDSGTTETPNNSENGTTNGTTTDSTDAPPPTPSTGTATSETPPETSTEEAATPTSTDAETVENIPDYADYWIKACPNYLTQIDLNAKGQKVAAILDIKTSQNSHVTDNKDGTLSYIPNKDFSTGVDTFSITYQTVEGNTADAIVKARMECKEVMKPAACKIYISHNSGKGNTQFLTLDPEAKKAVALGPTYRGYDIEGLAFNPKNKLLYALAGGVFAPKEYKGELYLVDPTTGNLSIVGNTGFPRVYGLTARTDGSLWAWVHTSNKKRPGGILQIDPETAIGSLKFISTVKIDGLAWSSDGKTLYGSQENNLWAWKYDGENFTPVIPKGAAEQQPVCSNLSHELEGLSALSHNMLLFGGRANKERDDVLVVFNPLSCKAVLTHTFTNPPFNTVENEELEDSMEGIVWAEDCQPEPKVATAEIQQLSDVEVCEESADWQAVIGKVHLTPADSKAYVKTSWSIISPSGAQCPSDDGTTTVPCNTVLSSQIVGNDETFSINGWWPGIPKGVTTQVEVTAQAFDMQDNPISEETTAHLKSGQCEDYKVTREAVIKNYLAELSGVDSFEYNYTEDGIIATLVMGGQNKYRVKITPVKPATLDDMVRTILKTTRSGDADDNGFSPEVHLIFADNKRAEAHFSRIQTITYKSALTNYLAQLTTKKNIVFGANGALAVTIDGEVYMGTLYPELSGGNLPSKQVEFQATDDVDGNGYNDFMVRYADGVEQVIYITAMPGEEVVEEVPADEEVKPVAEEIQSETTEEKPAATESATSTEPEATEPTTAVKPEEVETTEPTATVKPEVEATEPTTAVKPEVEATEPTTAVKPEVEVTEPATAVKPEVETTAPAPVVEPVVVETTAPAPVVEPVVVEVTAPAAPVVVEAPAPVEPSVATPTE